MEKVFQLARVVVFCQKVILFLLELVLINSVGYFNHGNTLSEACYLIKSVVLASKISSRIKVFISH